jgi:hypothetical protein
MGNEKPVRTGEEAELREELEEVDVQVGERPEGSREERAREHFEDLHGDEDLDPNTSEADTR